MSHIKKLSCFINEDNGLLSGSRQELIDYIITNINKANDSFILKTSEDLGVSIRSIGNKKLVKAFDLMSPEEWNGISPELRRDWITSYNPDLEKSIRGKSFISMICNNEWSVAKSNIANFLENENVFYIKKLNEDEEDFVKPVSGYINKNNREELLISIYRQLNSASLETLKGIYQKIVLDPTIVSIKEPVFKLVSKLDEIGEDQWEDWTDSYRYLFLIKNSPIPVNSIDIKQFYKLLSREDFALVKSKIPKLIDFQAENN